MQEDRDIKANILIQIDNAVMHRLINNQKTLFASGACKIAKIQNPNQNVVYFINLNSFYYTLNKGVNFVKIPFGDSVSYLFPHFDNGLSSITFLNDQATIHNFDQIISNAATLLTFEQATQNPQIKLKIDTHCLGVEKQPIHQADKIKATIKQAGKVLGAGFKFIGSFLAQGVNYVGEMIDKKVDQSAQKDNVAPQTKQKWQNLKKGTSNALNVSKDLYSQYLASYVNAGLQYGKTVVQKIQSSDNPTIKYATQLASTSGEALGVAFQGLSDGSSEIGNEIGTQSRKIVNKKYGEDYVNTFLPNQVPQSTEKKEENKEQQNINETEGGQDKPLYPQIDKTHSSI